MATPTGTFIAICQVDGEWSADSPYCEGNVAFCAVQGLRQISANQHVPFPCIQSAGHVQSADWLKRTQLRHCAVLQADL